MRREPENGCETHTDADGDHCGYCGNVCLEKQSVTRAECHESICYALECEVGTANCDGIGENGCEVTFLDNPDHCGACFASCYDLPNNLALPSCSGDRCELDCADGWDDCDGNDRNGCEASLEDDPNNCGACGETCAYHCVGGECVSIVSVAAGNRATCAVLNIGEVWCWGDASSGELGGGVAVITDRPLRVEGIPPMVEVKAGTSKVCGRSIDDELWCWGNGYMGLGSANQTRQKPNQVSGADDVYDFSLSGAHGCYITHAGELWCWGSGSGGRLGNGSTDNELVPKRVELPAKAASVGMSSSSTCAATEGGAVYCWGTNTFGQLGQGDTTERHVPTLVSGVSGVAQVDGGNSQFIAVTKSGAVWGWGLNGSGRLGNGNATTQRNPVQTSTLTDVAAVDTGSGHTCALTQSGEVWCWGSNTYGQLGLGFNDGTNLTPAKVELPTKMKAIWLGLYHTTYALSEEGMLWVWGQNDYGQFGDGTAESSHTPMAPPLTFED